ncbi:MAG: potassium channel family protein [Armatimonadota bacterium]
MNGRGWSARPSQPGLGVLRLPERSPVRSLLVRLGVAVGLIVIASLLLWLHRDSLRDNTHPDRPLAFSDVFYYTVVSLTTVGYGDIVPVTQGARLFNAIFMTPIRVVLWALFLGTAYELILQQYRERVQMRRLSERLRGHTIVCGYGVKGEAIVSELLAHGHAPDQIVVIDPTEEAVQRAAGRDLVALRGDASSEAILQAAAVEKAGHVLVGPNRDDACVLICLTVRTLAPKVRLVASAREEENVKLIYKAGADVVVTPSASGGRLMAAAVRQTAVTAFLEDLMQRGAGLDARERVVRPEEAGRKVADLADLRGRLVLGVSRGGERCPFYGLSDWVLQPGDAIVYLEGAPRGRE